MDIQGRITFIPMSYCVPCIARDSDKCVCVCVCVCVFVCLLVNPLCQMVHNSAGS